MISEAILLRLTVLVNRPIGKALLDHTGIDFINGVGQEDRPAAGKRTAILLVAFVDHTLW